jgi:hypothetical protein
MTGLPAAILTPHSSNHRVPFAAQEIEAPTSPAKSARSYIVTLWPAFRREMAAHRPPAEISACIAYQNIQKYLPIPPPITATSNTLQLVSTEPILMIIITEILRGE